MITEQKIENFLVLAEELNFTHAADRLFITQQALSKQIRDLEKDIGAPLFVRTTKSVALTPLGEELRDLFSGTSKAYREILHRYLEPQMSALRICYFEDMDLGVPLYETKGRMDRDFPGLEYQFSTRPRFLDILHAMEAREIDLAIIPDAPDFKKKGYHALMLHQDRIFICYSAVLCADQDHPRIEDLRDAVFYLGSEENLARPVLERYCQANGFMPKYYSGKPLAPSVERMLIEGGAGAGMGGRYSILSRDPLMKRIELEEKADIVAVWRDGPDERIMELFASQLRDILNP